MARIVALPALVLAAAAPAQTPGSVQDFQLPPSAPSPSATAAGPVDSDHPTAEPTRPASAAPAPAPSPVVIVPPPVTAARPAPRAERRAQAAPSPVPSASSSPAAPVPAIVAPMAQPTLAPPTVAASPDPDPAPAARPAPTWPWWAGGGVLVLLAGAWLYRRPGRLEAEPEPYEAPASPEPARPDPSPPATLPRPQELNRTPPPPAPLPEPAPPAVAAGPLEMQFEARHLSRAMVNAALAYRLTLTNRADAATGPLRVTGDIVSAHASLSAEEQLLPADAALAPIHEAATLAPGESVSLTGELRMPIASILPIHSGGARVFVPLARFRAEAGNGTTATRVFVVGQASEQPGGALRPFPLDRGPGIDRGLDQRELGVPA